MYANVYWWALWKIVNTTHWWMWCCISCWNIWNYGRSVLLSSIVLFILATLSVQAFEIVRTIASGIQGVSQDNTHLALAHYSSPDYRTAVKVWITTHFLYYHLPLGQSKRRQQYCCIQCWHYSCTTNILAILGHLRFRWVWLTQSKCCMNRHRFSVVSGLCWTTSTFLKRTALISQI